MKQAVLCIGHGSRIAAGANQAARFMERCMEDIEVPIKTYAFLELAEPTIAAGMAQCHRQGATHVAVFPLLLLSAGHAKKDIPGVLQQEQEKYPHMTISYGRPIGVCEEMIDVLMARMYEQATIQPSASVLLVGRGSSDPQIHNDFARIRTMLLERFPFVRIHVAYLAAAQPSFDEGLEQMEDHSAPPVFIVPYLLFSGMLMREMKQKVERYHQAGHSFLLCDALGHHEKAIHVVQKRIHEAIKYIKYI